MVWEGGDGLNGMPMGELTGLVRELVGEMRGFREELREVKKVVEKGLKNVVRASHSWHRSPVGDVLDYVEWWAEFPQEEMEEEYQELWWEDLTYWEYLKEKQVDKEKLDELVSRTMSWRRAKRKGEMALRSRSPRWIWRSDMSEMPWVPSSTTQNVFLVFFLYIS